MGEMLIRACVHRLEIENTRRRTFEQAAEALQCLWRECQIEKKRFYVEGKYEHATRLSHHCEAFKAAADRIRALAKTEEQADG